MGRLARVRLLNEKYELPVLEGHTRYLRPENLNVGNGNASASCWIRIQRTATSSRPKEIET